LPNSRADKNLTGLSLIAKARRDIRDGANSCVIPATLEPNRPERRESMSNADAEAKVVTKVAPSLDQSPDCSPHIVLGLKFRSATVSSRLLIEYKDCA